MSRKLFLILLPVACSLAFPAELPIDGIAYVGFRVSNIEQARGFYEGVLGLEEAFRVPSPDGPAAHYFKVNDDQFVRLTADLKPGQDERLVEIGLQTSDIKTLRRMLVARGLQPAAIVRGDDGSAACALTDPDGHRLRFLQYLPGRRPPAPVPPVSSRFARSPLPRKASQQPARLDGAAAHRRVGP